MNIKHFNIAKMLAEKSTSRYRLGCVISYKNVILSKGINDMSKTHPLSNAYGNTLHAEINALSKIKYNKNLKYSTVYVYRLLKNNKSAYARPCRYCLDKLKQYGIKRIFYTGYNDKLIKEII